MYTSMKVNWWMFSYFKLADGLDRFLGGRGRNKNYLNYKIIKIFNLYLLKIVSQWLTQLYTCSFRKVVWVGWFIFDSKTVNLHSNLIVFNLLLILTAEWQFSSVSRCVFYYFVFLLINLDYCLMILIWRFIRKLLLRENAVLLTTVMEKPAVHDSSIASTENLPELKTSQSHLLYWICTFAEKEYLIRII